MRKLTFLGLAFALALYACVRVAGADSPAGYVVRDGLLYLALAGIVFALAAGAMPPLSVTGMARRWPLDGRILTALAVGLAALAALLGAGSVWASGVWALAFALLAAGVWRWGERESYAQPAYRWTTDAAGHWVRAALEGGVAMLPADTSLPGALPARRMLLLPLLIVGGAGVFLRLWQLGDLPAGCVGAECEAALRLVESPFALTSLYDVLAHALYRVTGDGLYSLRLAGAGIGALTLPLFYWAARPLDRAGGAALATMLLALTPWHIVASRTADPWIAAPLLISLALGAGLRAFASVDRRWWWAAGLAAGLLIVDAGPVRGAAITWAAVTLALAAWTLATAPVSTATRVYNLAAYLAAAAVVALPGLALSIPFVGMESGAVIAGAGGVYAVLTGFLHSGATTGSFLDMPLLAALPASLAVLGLGRLARSLNRPYAALILAGAAAFGATLARVGLPATPISSQALALLAFLFLAAAVSTDTLLLTFCRTWGALVPSRYALGGALAVVLAAGVWQAVGLTGSLQEISSGPQRSVDAAIGRHIARCLAAGSYATCVLGDEPAAAGGDDEPAYEPVIYAPSAALTHPSTRLLLGAQADSERLRVLDIARDVPPAPMPDGPALYLTPIDDQPSINLLQQFYPGAQMQALPLNEGPTQFVAFAVNREDLLERQGIQGLYFAGANFGTPDTASMSSRDGPLAFTWRDDPPLPSPFSVQWDGSLRVPASGAYVLSVDWPPAMGAGQTAFTLLLDDRLVLDSSLGLLQKEEALAQGFYRLSMRFRTDQPPHNWAVRWQVPGGEPQIIPRDALYSPALPDVGLIGTYYGGEGFDGPVLTSRKDLIVGGQADLPAPYSVRWQGKLAAPRAGEYLFAANSNGGVQMLLDGRDLLAYVPESADPQASAYAQASVYLPQGWHDIEIRYAPADSQPALRILWQPPGSSPSLLLSRNLRPELAPMFPGDALLPAAPELLDPALGDDGFALSYSNELIRPQTVIPPADLPPLLFEAVWRAGGTCGSGADQLNAPHGLAVDAAAGRVYAADTGNRRIVVYDMDSGAVMRTYADTEFQEPVDLALNPDGDLIVLDAVGHPLLRVDALNGETVRIAAGAEFYRPRGLDVDALGQILVADTGGGRVVVLDADGQMLAQYGGQGTLLSTGQPVDALAAAGWTWAITAEDGRLWRLDDLSGLTALPRANTLDGPHLAALPDGSFFLTDPVGGSVRYHAASGQPLRQLAYPGAFVTPTGVAAAEADGFVYLAVADSATCSVSLWRGAPFHLLP